MTKEEFGKWYRKHITEMVDAGIMHPESEGGKWVKLALTTANAQYGPILKQMQERINALEALVHGEKVKITPKQKVIEPEVIIEEKPVEVKKQANTKRRRKSTSSGWSV